MRLSSHTVRGLSGDGLMWAVAALVAAATLWCGACNGNIGAPGAGPPSGAGGGGGTGPTTGGGSGGASFGTCRPAAGPGVTPLTKLSTLQYRNTVRDLLAASGLGSLATEIAPALAGVPDDSLSLATFRGLDPRISGDHIQSYFNVAAAVGNAVEASPARLTAVAGSCATVTPLGAACVNSFLAGFGRRAFRRPLTSAEQASLAALNDGQRSPAEAIRAMIVVLLMSPRFVNHLELEGAPGYADFTKRYKDRFKADSGPYAIYSFASAQILLESIQKAGTTDGAKLAAAIHAGSFDTPVGRIEFDDKGDIKATGYYTVWVVKGGKHVLAR